MAQDYNRGILALALLFSAVTMMTVLSTFIA